MGKIISIVFIFCISLYGSSSGVLKNEANLEKISWHTEPNESELNWNSADKYCNELSIDGVDKWRLPTMKELINKKTKFKKTYSEFYSYYWSSTIYKKNPDYAWVVTNTKYKDYHNKELKNFVGCVTNKSDEPIEIVEKIKFVQKKIEKEKIDSKEVEIKKVVIEKTPKVVPLEIQKIEPKKDLVIAESKIEPKVESKVEDEVGTEESALVRNIFLIIIVLLIL
ncbi:MAG: DUF1566 domain-containing protein [Campylobacterota bacterium]|nr:DUF1566 domain-containing protein [Campylobacterota bacterium]